MTTALRPLRPLRTRAWWVMRQMTTWELGDLLCTVAHGFEADAADNLRQWLKALEQAGIVTRYQPVRLHPAEMSISRPTLYTLARDIGPLPPVWQRRAHAVLDPNSGTAHLFATAQTAKEAS